MNRTELNCLKRESKILQDIKMLRKVFFMVQILDCKMSFVLYVFVNLKECICDLIWTNFHYVCIR